MDASGACAAAPPGTRRLRRRAAPGGLRPGRQGREVLTFIDGGFTQPGPWSLDGAAALGGLLRELHQATRSFRPPPEAVWFPWHGRDLGSPVKVMGPAMWPPGTSSPKRPAGRPHRLGDRRAGRPAGGAGPAGLAQRQAPRQHRRPAGAPAAPGRPGSPARRHRRRLRPGRAPAARLPEADHEFAICDTAWEADDAAITPETTAHPIALWAMAWRARSAAWIIRHRRILETALTRGRRDQLEVPTAAAGVLGVRRSWPGSRRHRPGR